MRVLAYEGQSLPFYPDRQAGDHEIDFGGMAGE